MKDVDWPMWPTATVPLANPGLLVGERYELRSQIGVGAMGAVWLAQDQRLSRAVALKQVVLEPGLDHRQAVEARQRILREGRIAARLQHPHAVSIYDVTMHDGEPWLVMEYLPSRSLASVLTQDGLLSDRAAARIGLQLADALDAAHRAGIVHRDVKPGNVLVGHDGTAKLVDFGIARASGDITVTQTGVLTGTPDYFAPEVARGQKPSPEADIFALGATLYICVEGQPPFGTSKNALTQLQVVADGTIRPPRQAGLLTSVLHQLLATDPAERPSARRAATLLRSVALGTTGAPPPAATDDPATNDPATPLPEPRTTQIPPPRSAPESWLPSDRALPPTPNELAGHSMSIPIGRAAHRMRGLDGRRRITLSAVLGVAALAVVTAVVLTSMAAQSSAVPEPSPLAATGAPLLGSPAAAAQLATDGELTDTVREYFALLPRDPDEAWGKLTDKAQVQFGGRSAFTGMWSDIASLRLISTSSTATEQSVRAQISLETNDGQTQTSTQRLAVVAGPAGQWLIDTVER